MFNSGSRAATGLCVILTAVLAGCGGDDSGTPGNGDAGGQLSAAVRTSVVTTDDCASGSGIEVDSGIDENGNGTLDDGEVDDTQLVCDGTAGTDALVETETVPAGDRCPDGGVLVRAGQDDDGDGMLGDSEVDSTDTVCNGESGRFALQLLHLADMDGAPEALQNVNGFSALVDAFRDDMPASTLVLSSGDNYIPGPRYFAASDDALVEELGAPGNGRGDIAFVNALGVRAAALGNHDLDDGTEAFAGIIAPDGDYPGAAFPYISANVDFSTDANLSGRVVDDGLLAEDGAGAVAGSAVVLVNGERIGIVGASTPALASITSTGGLTINPPLVDNDEQLFDDLAAAIQPTVNALRASGIDKIVLLGHMQQIAIEKALAVRLEGVDIIVAGGSNTLLADGDDILRDGDTAADTYPLLYTSPADEPVLVVNVDGDYRYLGRLVVEFDGNGVLDLDSLDPALNGAWASTQAVVDMVGGTPIPRVAEVSEALAEVLVARDGNVLGNTAVFLDGRRSEVRTEETNLGNLTADANLWYAQQADPEVDISLKNGGGIRSAIGQVLVQPGSNEAPQLLPPAANEAVGKPAGGVSQFDVEGSLRFNNSLTLLTVTADELLDIMEHGVSATAPGATPGQFPQIGGMRIAFDPNATARQGGDTNGGAAVMGERIRTLEIIDENGAVLETVVANGILQVDPNRSFRMVTLNFTVSCVAGTDNMASDACGDGYPFKNLTAPDRADLPLAADFDPAFDPGNADFAGIGTEQDAFAEYLFNFHPDAAMAFDQAETDPAADMRIENLGASAP
ncbi:bifunctional metallophosphatase/5'-nucleotidase [Salinisphaera sp. P385]|uniref:Bifunctional metallophosphatase/5'-nucleotidase n=1 Tax=Spectribacter acetivorans TaxID=3075603 RepID=A0ABU3BAM2_9GAMM|nr:bifunctional metallophosphatase/5'-nucleotidase [Salinisphaera sp. P385]MDT0619510.1 bifunctional metallophosphatase/5'-nucleotidase [Salinisphaera sp. P385]